MQVGNNGSTGSLGSGPVTVNANGSLSLMRSDAFFTVANTLTGAGNIYQNGSGSATLSGPASGFTGTITVNNGNLYLNSANSTSYITVAPGAVLGGRGTAGVATAELQNGASIEAGQSGTGSLTLAGLTLDNNVNININNLLQYSSTNNSAPAAIKVTGSNALSAQTNSQYGIQLYLGGAPFYNTVPEDARLLAYTGSSNLGQLANLTVANNLNINIPGISGRTVFNFLPLSADPGYIDLQFSVDYPIWTGTGNGVWDNNVNQSPQNWKLASSGTNNTPTNFQVNDAAVFDDSAGTGHTVVSLNGTGNVDPSSVTFNNNVLSYTISGANAIEGAAVVTMNGSGSVTILNANTYYGGTTINAGRLNIGNQFALGSAANYVANGAAFTINGGSIDNVTGAALTTDNYPINWNGGFTFVGSNPLNLGAGAVTLGTSTAAVKVSGSTLEIDGAIGDAGLGYGFTQSGAGLLLLTGSSTYLGPTVVNGGTLQIGNGGSGASIGSTSNVVLAANTLLLFDHNDSQTFPASISGAGGMTQSGAGLLNLTNSNTYTGATTVAGGTLELSFGGPTGTLAPNSTVTVQAGATLQLNAQGALGSSGSATSLVVNDGTVYANAGYRTTLWNTVNLTGGTLASDPGNGDGNGNYSLSGQVNATSDASGNPTVIAATQVSLVSNTVLNVTHGNAASPADLIVASVISSLPSGNGLTLQGNGFTQFAGANTYNGGTSVLGGTLQLASPTATLGASSGGLTVASGALLDINGDNTSVGGLNGGGTIDNVAGAFGSTPVLTVGNGGGGGTFSGTIQDSYGSTTLTKVGAGTQVLSGTNTYTGGTNVNAGVLNFGPSALGSGLVTFGGGTLQWAAGNTLDVSTSPGIAAIPSGISAGINTNGNNVTFNTGLSGAGGLTKTGAGTLTMTALNTYTGQTNISAGTIDVTEPTGLSLQYSTVNVNVNGGLVIAAPTATLGGLSGSGSVNLSAITPTALTVGANNANTTYTGVLSGGSGLTKTGTGTLTLSNAQNYNGPTDIAGGTLRASTAAPGNGLNILPTATSVTISNGATFDMSNATQSIASLNSTDGLGSQVLLSTKGLLTVGNAASSTFDGVISGSGGQVVLHGPGSMLFTGSNTYTAPRPSAAAAPCN